MGLQLAFVERFLCRSHAAEIRLSVVFRRISRLYAVLFKVQISLQRQERVNHRLYDPRITTSDLQ